MPIISGPAGMDPILGRMRTKDIQGGTASGNYTFNSAEFTVGAAGLVSLNQVPSSKLDTTMDIVNVTGTSVTLQPNTAYKMYATTGALNVTANPPAANKWAYEGHAEIFVGSVGYVVFDTSKIVLANQLEPDSVNNCTLRFHDGMCYVSVEDHIAGYIVVNGSTAGDGSLYYGITTSTNDYVAFDASLNGTTIPLAGATAEGEKHVVGNGYTETAITGAVNCGTSKFTVANLGLNDVQVTGGVMTLGDVFIPSGSTVAVSGGGLAVEKVTGNGGVIDFAGGPRGLSLAKNGELGGVTLANATYPADSLYGPVTVYSAFYFHDVTFADTLTGGFAPALGIRGSGVSASGCTMNAESTIWPDGVFELKGGNKVNGIYRFNNGNSTAVTSRTPKLILAGSNAITGSVFPMFGTMNVGLVNISSGATIDLTGNTNATPIAPGGGITISGGATVLTGATAGVVENTAVISGDLAGMNSIANDGTISGVAIYAPVGAQTNTYLENVKLSFTNLLTPTGNVRTFNGCTINGSILFEANASNASAVFSGTNKVKTLYGSSGAVYDVEITDGATVDLTLSTWSVPLSVTGTLIIGSGCTCIAKNGTSVSLSSGTYTSKGINQSGEIVDL